MLDIARAVWTGVAIDDRDGDDEVAWADGDSDESDFCDAAITRRGIDRRKSGSRDEGDLGAGEARRWPQGAVDGHPPNIPNMLSRRGAMDPAADAATAAYACLYCIAA